uniref:Putative transporter C11D3.18C n=1 Tax=Talaromyces marneffei PM1 TaxID=1077442 RepID=A0A093XSM8_TALMA
MSSPTHSDTEKPSASAIENGIHNPLHSRETENKLLRKMDLRLIPMLATLYLLAFLDRGNIGNAKIEGMLTDLHMTGQQYSLAHIDGNCAELSWSFGVPYFPGSGCLYRAEAGLYPGIAYYITLWYPRDRAQYRQALFFSAASVAGAFSGLLAYGIAKMNGVGGYAGWRWIFILEGLLTVAVSLIAPFAIHDFPETAKFLTEEERELIITILRNQTTGEGFVHADVIQEETKFRARYVIDALTDWQIYLGLFMYWGITCPLYGISFFLPSIIKDLGYTSSTAQLLTVPIYITAAVVAIGAAWLSDRRKQRSPFLLFFMSLIAIGFIVVIASSGRGAPGVVYLGVFIAVVGIYPAFPGNVTWIAVNLAGDYKRAAGMALHIGLGNMAGAMASNFYRSQDAPKYILGHALELGFCVAGIIAVLILRRSYETINRRRDQIDVSQYDANQIAQMGDRSPMFRKHEGRALNGETPDHQLRFVRSPPQLNFSPHLHFPSVKGHLVPRRTQFSSCDACRKSRVACDAMKGRSALTSPTWMNSCTRCQNRGRHCTFEVANSLNYKGANMLIKFQWIEKAALPNSKRKYDVLRDVHEPPPTTPEARATPESLLSLRVCARFLSASFRDNGCQDPKQLALSVSISRLCQECDYWMKRVQGQGMNLSEEGESPGEIDSDRQINHSLSCAVSAFSARWLPLKESSALSELSVMDIVESLWREVRRDILRVINRPCYRSALTLFLFALTPIPARVSEEEENDGIPAQFCVQVALQQVLTLRALQKSLEFNGSKVTSISSATLPNATTSPAPVTRDFLGIESMIYWAAMTFDTSSSLTLNTKSLLSPGLSLGLEQEPSWRLVRTCTNVFHEETEAWRAQGIHITEERANQIIASAASWKLFVWKAAALVKEALREGREDETVQVAFDTAVDAINQYSLTYHDLLIACERRIQFFSHKTKLRWYELILHYNLSILVMLDAVEIAGRMDLLEKLKVVKADAEGSLFNCLIFGLNNHYLVPRRPAGEEQHGIQLAEEDGRAAALELTRKVPLIAIDPYPHHVVAGVRILWKAVERDLENDWLDYGVAEHMQDTMLNALKLLPQASKSVQTVRQQAEASFIRNSLDNTHYNVERLKHAFISGTPAQMRILSAKLPAGKQRWIATGSGRTKFLGTLKSIILQCSAQRESSPEGYSAPTP